MQFVDIVFGVVVAQAFVRYDQFVLSPSSSWFVTLALTGVFVTATSSWIGYHRSMNQYPYETDNGMAVLRMSTDLFIVAAYAFILLSLKALTSGPGGSPLARYLWGYFAIWPLYLVSGFFRKMEKREPGASVSRLIVTFGGIHLLLAITYPWMLALLPTQVSSVNWVYMLACPSAQVAYRLVRHRSYLGQGGANRANRR